MKYFVYILRSLEFQKLYIGSSADPDNRLKAHNAGRGGWTKNFRPWERIWLEEFEEKSVALKREKYLKSGWGRKWIEKNV